MDLALLQRQAALGGVALLAALGALALSRLDEPEGPSEVTPALGGDWERAVAASFGAGAYGKRTACGVELTPKTRGVAHPVLPCGVDVVISYRGREVRTEVVDRGPYEAGREFDLTQALARDLGLEGTQTIRWRFAG